MYCQAVISEAVVRRLATDFGQHQRQEGVLYRREGLARIHVILVSVARRYRLSTLLEFNGVAGQRPEQVG